MVYDRDPYETDSNQNIDDDDLNGNSKTYDDGKYRACFMANDR